LLLLNIGRVVVAGLSLELLRRLVQRLLGS
jgi:hypothetical protein